MSDEEENQVSTGDLIGIFAFFLLIISAFVGIVWLCVKYLGWLPALAIALTIALVWGFFIYGWKEGFSRFLNLLKNLGLIGGVILATLVLVVFMMTSWEMWGNWLGK